MEQYRDFFTASAGASAAFIGLLFVALAYIDTGSVDERAKEWRRIMASSSYAQLTNIFFVSIAALLPDPHNPAIIACVLAILGLVVSLRLLPRTIEHERTGRRTPSRLGLLTVAAYLLELVCAIGLLRYPDQPQLLNYFVLSIIILYGGALARAWEITGIKRR